MLRNVKYKVYKKAIFFNNLLYISTRGKQRERKTLNQYHLPTTTKED